MIGEFGSDTGIDLTGDRKALQRLKEAAEKPNVSFPRTRKRRSCFPGVSAGASGPAHLNTVLTRMKFDKMIEPVLEHTLNLCADTLRDVGLHVDEIDDVILVGGQTRTPAVFHTVEGSFHKRTVTVHPSSGLTGSEVERARLRPNGGPGANPRLGKRTDSARRFSDLPWSTRTALHLLGRTLTREERNRALTAARRAEQGIDGTVADLQSALSALEVAAEALADKMLKVQPLTPRTPVRWFPGLLRFLTRFWSARRD